MCDRLEARVVNDRVYLDLIHDPGDGFDLVRTRLGRLEDAEADVPLALRGEYAILCVEYGEFFDEWSPCRDGMALAKEGSDGR